jgi:hypothetical protein
VKFDVLARESIFQNAIYNYRCRPQIWCFKSEFGGGTDTFDRINAFIDLVVSQLVELLSKSMRILKIG